MSSGLKKIVHLDMDAYFASVEQQCNPSLRGKPIIVTGRGKRTVVTTASYEARKYGVKTGMTVAEAQKLCPDLIRVDGNPDKYLYTNFMIREILIGFTDRVETYSIDEFFLDITGSTEDVVGEIKYRVRESTRLSCSCGLAPNKLLAKLGSKMQKPDGLTIIDAENMQDILEITPVDKLHGLGSKTAEHLNKLGIKTAGELGNAPIGFLMSHFGFWGHILKCMGQGIDNSPVPYYWEHNEPKSMGHSFTLPRDITDIVIIKTYILMLCQKVAMRLQNQGKAAQTIALTIRYSDFRTFCFRKSAGCLVYTIHGIYYVCLKILNDIGKPKKPVRLLGVCASNLVDNSRQLYLLDELEKLEKLDKAILGINNKYGEFTIRPASLLMYIP